ncbi:hypothetical protein AMC82_PC00329 (plasmid) [Rhizobium phaseoli]|uniref:Uncharacterized protein n=1 Tax=Rhizobium aethiopicum TaxID=1138170 RepID=A0A1C3YCS3_9HYPH|nr:hypothetical protein AMK01_PB00336 [Rhizobium sp. N6212]ANL00403.1 hypothetical protein AMK00_PB00335 [Rhizobium sp. N621]ANL06524.1 hypothetical protein AMJ99_PB00327 [Rhizobium esperanzae]ANL12695.1 hypothetical protein AMJ98_PC00333 [Rhizobium sp. N1341]ANL68895.1 hypothetical protein AMC84_PC00333 [Rhizobium phaseoli]ANM37368.1 hypothetical protein AMK04_PB00332 [Rhizobium sp. N871]ANM43518.1 hypothetical protein AMK03_PC00330 [Rhizobium sp. N741]ARQ60877.1 hypothetical protein Kim5_P
MVHYIFAIAVPYVHTDDTAPLEVLLIDGVNTSRNFRSKVEALKYLAFGSLVAPPHRHHKLPCWHQYRPGLKEARFTFPENLFIGAVNALD